ncbi:GNAT family N-acetyltransferase [Chitinimonas sp.]|uniref:GNAT family N-acetyltransferase n=1 Tax=Chitinimonas sp. TaxID=1934313 RepID=UPI002F925748
MSAVTLRAMDAASFAAFQAWSTPAYAASNIKSGRWTEAEAPAKAQAQVAQLLPQGRETPNHHFFDVIDTAGAAVGVLWFALNPGLAGAQAWVYEIMIQPQYRGQGLGRATMQAFEAEARNLGATSLGLNVFGYNEPALALYRSLGFLPTAIQMAKQLA